MARSLSPSGALGPRLFYISVGKIWIRKVAFGFFGIIQVTTHISKLIIRLIKRVGTGLRIQHFLRLDLVAIVLFPTETGLFVVEGFLKPVPAIS